MVTVYPGARDCGFAEGNVCLVQKQFCRFSHGGDVKECGRAVGVEESAFISHGRDGSFDGSRALSDSRQSFFVPSLDADGELFTSGFDGSSSFDSSVAALTFAPLGVFALSEFWDSDSFANGLVMQN